MKTHAAALVLRDYMRWLAKPVPLANAAVCVSGGGKTGLPLR